MSKLLIVDDSADLLETMKYVLERKGYIVRTLMNADNIYRRINEFQPDLLILDIHVAGEDGREICKKLKKSSQNNELPVLMFSASPKLLEDFESCHADDFIEKPFQLTDLVEKIKLVLARASAIQKTFQSEAFPRDVSLIL
jgi:DNA-binding response OmpR family regulator